MKFVTSSPSAPALRKALRNRSRRPSKRLMIALGELIWISLLCPLLTCPPVSDKGDLSGERKGAQHEAARAASAASGFAGSLDPLMGRSIDGTINSMNARDLEQLARQLVDGTLAAEEFLRQAVP